MPSLPTLPDLAMSVWILTVLVIAQASAASISPPHRGAAHPDDPPLMVPVVHGIPYAHADTVVGDGTPGSVTEEAIRHALASGGVITFDTGGRPVVVAITSTLILPQGSRPTIIDGRGLITLDGGDKVQILRKAFKTDLVVEHLRFLHGCAAKSGGAIGAEAWDGHLTVVDCWFDHCRCTSPGPDIGGGAIRALGQRRFLVSACVFDGCSASNGGAICSLGCGLDVVGCRFTGNTAFGTGGGADAGPGGQGGIGGAVYMDGCSQNADQHHAVFSDCLFVRNSAKDHAGAIFNYTYAGSHSLVEYNACIFAGNAVSPRFPGQHLGFAGAIYEQDNDVVITNCSFLGNHAPSMGGSIFIATQGHVTIRHSEIAGNEGGGGHEGMSVQASTTMDRVGYDQPRVSVATLYLGRVPGPRLPTRPGAPATSRTAASSSPGPSASVPAPPVPASSPQMIHQGAGPLMADAATQATWSARLRRLVAADLAAGRSPGFHARMFASDVQIRSMDKDGALHVTMGGGRMDMAWKSLGQDDLTSLAIDVAHGTPLDQATAAFFLLLSDRRSDGEMYLAKSGPYASEILALVPRSRLAAAPGAGVQGPSPTHP